MSIFNTEEFKEFLNDDIKLSNKLLYKKGLCGLSNLGNTCFMNSIIQCLNNTYPLIEYFFNNDWRQDLRDDKVEHLLVEQCNNITRSLWFTNAVVTPSNFLRVLFRVSVQLNNHQFVGFNQNDCQDFLQFLLDCMHNGLSKEVIMNINGKAETDIDKHAIQAYENWKKFYNNDYSKIVEIFSGQFFKKIVTIKNGNTETNYTYEPFLNLSLEIPISKLQNNEMISVYDCLDHFTSEEVIVNNETQKTTSECFFWTVADILIIYFKRYAYNSESNRSNKIGVFIDFPINGLNMSKYMKGYKRDRYVYDLYAVANQVGGINSGHYYAYVKNFDKNWYKYDDSVVSTLDTNEIVTSAAYCLFYHKKKYQE